MAATGQVFLIGAGPGDPGLVTWRGVRLIAQADVIVYDRAAEPALRWARPDAERIAAGAPAEREMAQDALSMLIAEKARDGHTVARLKWGDPFVFDSGAKEAMFLHEQGIPFEVIPGVPVAIGAAAYAGIPLTHPESGDAIVFVRGHEAGLDARPGLDWSGLAALDGTLVCFAASRLVAQVLEALIAHGRSGDDAAALVFAGTRPRQRTVSGTVGSLLAYATGDDADNEPALLVVGDVTALREHVRWFDARPLFGRRIIVTRSPEGAQELGDALANLGAEPILAPTFRVGPPDDPEAVDRAAASVDRFDWVVFETALAAARFLTALQQGPRDLRAFGRTAICAVGPSTADELTARGLKPDVVLPELRVDSLSSSLEAHARIDGRSVLVVRPDHERDLVASALADRGAAVTDLIAYHTAADAPDSPAAQRIYRELLDGRIDAVTFASPSAVRRFASVIGVEQAADLLNTTIVAAIGPVTAAAAQELGIHTPVIAEEYTVEGLTRALVEHFSGAPTGSSRNRT